MAACASTSTFELMSTLSSSVMYEKKATQTSRVPDDKHAILQYNIIAISFIILYYITLCYTDRARRIAAEGQKWRMLRQHAKAIFRNFVLATMWTYATNTPQRKDTPQSAK